MLLLGLKNFADVKKFVLPSIQVKEREIGGLHQVRHDAGGNRRYRLLPQWGKWNDAVLDRVAAGLFVIGDEGLIGRVLFGDEPWRQPQGRRRGRSMGDIGPRQGARRQQSGRATKYRTPSEIDHPIS